MGKADPRLASLTEPPSLVPRSPGLSPSKALRPPPLWSPRSRQPPSPLVSEESQGCLGQAGPPAQGTDKAITLDARWVSQWCVHDPLHASSRPCPSSAWTPLPGKFLPPTSSLSAWMAQSWSSQTLPWGFLTCFWKRCCLLNGRLFWLTVSEFVFCELYQLGRGPGAAGAGEEAAAAWAGSRQAGGWAQGPAGAGSTPSVSEPKAAFQGPRSSLEVQGLGSTWGDSG